MSKIKDKKLDKVAGGNGGYNPSRDGYQCANYRTDKCKTCDAGKTRKKEVPCTAVEGGKLYTDIEPVPECNNGKIKVGGFLKPGCGLILPNNFCFELPKGLYGEKDK